MDWQLTPSKDAVIVTEKVTNNLSHSIYLPPEAVPIGVYRIKDNFELPEIGLQISRQPYDLSEFIEVLPQQSYKTHHPLNKIYGFPQGCYDYQMRMSTGYFYPDEKSVVNLGVENKEFTWCNLIDPFHGFFKDPLTQ